MSDNSGCYTERGDSKEGRFCLLYILLSIGDMWFNKHESFNINLYLLGSYRPRQWMKHEYIVMCFPHADIFPCMSSINNTLTFATFLLYHLIIWYMHVWVEDKPFMNLIDHKIVLCKYRYIPELITAYCIPRSATKPRPLTWERNAQRPARNGLHGDHHEVGGRKIDSVPYDLCPSTELGPPRIPWPAQYHSRKVRDYIAMVWGEMAEMSWCLELSGIAGTWTWSDEDWVEARGILKDKPIRLGMNSAGMGGWEMTPFDGRVIRRSCLDLAGSFFITEGTWTCGVRLRMWMSNVGLKRIEFRCFGKGIDPKRGFIVSWRVLDNVMDKEVNVDMREGIGTNVRGG